MHHVLELLLFFLFYITISNAAADFLQNPDFEIPLPNITANATSHSWLLTGANSIAGWSLNGTVWYVASAANSSFPVNGGHAVQLGQNGKISQKLTATGNDVLDYLVSFTVAAQNLDCANNRTALNVTLRFNGDLNISRLIYMQMNSSRNVWERHSLKLPQMVAKDYAHIEIESVATNSVDSITCWPIVDAFTVNRNDMPRWYNGNWLSNGGFEVGPAFLKKSADGIILNDEEERFYSPLQQWSIHGTIRCIDSKHYKVPRGEAAVELLSGWVQKDFLNLPTADTYTLNFTMGDANDSCVADFVVYVQVGSSMYNFTMKSNGTGSAIKQTLIFRVEASSETSISFYSYEETRTSDGVLCGPVVDDVFLIGSTQNEVTGSYGERVQVCNGVMVFSLFIAFVMMML